MDTSLLNERLFEVKEREGWSWDRIAQEINRIQGGRQGITGPTLYRYAHGLSRPRNEMLQLYVLGGLERLLGRASIGPSLDNGTQSALAEQIRERSEAHFQFLYLNSPVMMHSMDKEGRLINVNHRWLERLGFQWHEAIGRRLEEFAAPDCKQLLGDKFSETLFQRGSCTDVVIRLVQKNGQILEALLSANVVHEEWRETDCALAVLVDITDVKRESLELKLWQSLIENAPDIIMTVNQTGMILSINRTQPSFHKDEVIGSLVYEYIESAYHERVQKGLEQVFRTGLPTRYEIKGPGPNHEPTWYESHIGPIKRDGRVIAASIITSDSTDRRRAEERFRTLFEQNITGVFRVHVSGQILDCNDALAKMLGFRSREEVLKLRSPEFYFDVAEREQYIRILQQQGTVQNYELRHRRKDGQPVWVMANSKLLEDESGERTIILGTLLDITEKKRLEEKLLHQNDYLRALHETTLGLISHLNLDELLETIVTRAGGLLGTPHGYIYLAEPGQSEMVVRVAVGAIRQFIGQRLSLGEGLGGKVLQTGKPLAVRDYSAWMGRVKKEDFDQIHAVIGVPLKSGQKVMGVLALAQLDPEKFFGQDEIEILEQFAELASMALDNARLYEQAQNALAKREHWVGQLHQNLNESLTALKIELERIAKNSRDEMTLQRSVHEMLEHIYQAKKALNSVTTLGSDVQ